MSKKVLSGALAAMMLVSPTYAIEAAGGTGDVPVHLTQDATRFSVTVPTVLPVDVSATGVVTVANENKIINNSFGPVEVKSVSVESLGDWTLVDFNTDFKFKKVGLHEYGFQMNQADVQPDGSCAAEFEAIPGNGQINFVYDSKVATQNTALDKENIANVVFTIGWSGENATRPQLNATHKISKPKMDAALKNLTGKITFATTAYQGEGGIDISENSDGSVMAVVNGQDATVYSEGGSLGINSSIYAESGMFFGYKTKEMDLCGLDTREMTNMNCMFYDCTNLISINLSSFNTDNVINMSGMFGHSYALKSINLSSFNTSKVTDMSGMFSSSGFTNLDLSNFDTTNVITMRCMFMGCSMLKNINLSSFNTKQVTDMYGMFSSCNSLLNIDLKNFDTSNVTDISKMFSYCESLTTLDLSSFDLKNVINPSMVFNSSDNITVCYVRTQAEYDKLISDGYPALNIKFVVKN